MYKCKNKNSKTEISEFFLNLFSISIKIVVILSVVFLESHLLRTIINSFWTYSTKKKKKLINLVLYG